MLIYSILDKYKKDLKFLGKSEENIELVSTAITELKKHNITLEKMESTIDKIDDKYLQTKLEDLDLVYSKFEDNIVNKFIDGNDKLTILAENLEKTDYFKNSLIYIDEFVGFTPQEYEVIRQLLKSSERVTITSCCDNLDDSLGRDLDVFYSNKQTTLKLMNIAKEENINIEKTVELSSIYRLKNKELKHLEENLYGEKQVKYNGEVKNIEIFLAKNQYSEIENVAENIISLVKENKYKYGEISIITKNIDTYSSLAKAIFSKYKIPLYIDEKADLGRNILAKYILSIIEIFSRKLVI